MTNTADHPPVYEPPTIQQHTPAPPTPAEFAPQNAGTLAPDEKRRQQKARRGVATAAAVAATVGLVAAASVGVVVIGNQDDASATEVDGLTDATRPAGTTADRSAGAAPGVAATPDDGSQMAPDATAGDQARDGDTSNSGRTADGQDTAATTDNDSDTTTQTVETAPAPAPTVELGGAADDAVVFTDLAGPIVDALPTGADADDLVAADVTGTASFELPLTGALANASIDRGLRGRIGVATGAELAHLGAHLRDDQQYAYVDLGRQEFDLDLNIEGTAGIDEFPQRVSTVGSPGPSVFVTSLDFDYVYLSTPCAAMLPDDGGQPPKRKQNPHADSDASEIPGMSLDLSDMDPGGCGIGWSTGGFIPFAPLDPKASPGDDFGAHLVMDGTFPVAPATSIDGEMFTRIDADGVTAWANGELDIGVPLFKGALDVSVPAARGTFGIGATGTTLQLSIAGSTGFSDAEGQTMQFLNGIAPVSGNASIAGSLDFVNGELQPTSFFELSGDLRMGPPRVEGLESVSMNDISTADALLRVDSTGVLVRGAMSNSPFGNDLVVGEAELEMLIPFADPAQSFLAVQGALEIGGIGLGAEAELRVDANGAHAKGRAEIAGVGQLDVEGWLGTNGFQLTGAANVTLPIGDLDKVAAQLVDTTNNDEVIRVLNRQIDDRIEAIASSDADKGRKLRNTVADMRVAFADIDSVNDTIAYNDGKIAQLWRDHQADIDEHWALSPGERFLDKIPHGIRLGVILGEIEALKFANTVQKGYIDAANLVISTTQQTVLALVGWDGELNALLALQTEAYVKTLTGNFVATVLNGADAILDAFGIDGSATGSVYFTIGTEGLAAEAELTWCRDGDCSVLAGATVQLQPLVEVCATIVGVPACAKL